jgi:hypothetical protein
MSPVYNEINTSSEISFSHLHGQVGAVTKKFAAAAIAV